MYVKTDIWTLTETLISAPWLLFIYIANDLFSQSFRRVVLN